MSKLTRKGYFSQRKAAAFSRQLGVQCGDNPTICFRFRPGEFFQSICLPAKWQRMSDGYFVVWCRNTESPQLNAEEDSKGKRITETCITIRVPVDDFPPNVPWQEWINCEVFYAEANSEKYERYYVANVPMADRGGRLTMMIDNKQAVYNDSPGAGGGRDERNVNYRRF